METFYVYTEIVNNGIHYTFYLEVDTVIHNVLLTISKSVNNIELYKNKCDVFFCSPKIYTRKQVDNVLIGTIDRCFPGDIVCLPLGFYNSKFLVNIGENINSAKNRHNLYSEITNMEWICPSIYLNTPESWERTRI